MHRINVLVVDDEPVMRTLFQFMLETNGHRVTTAGNGQEALNAIERSPNWYHIVVTDMVMPVMDGEKLIRRLQRTCPSLKIIAVSGSGNGKSPRDYLKIAKSLDVDKALSKPIDAMTLRAAVWQVAGRS